MIAHKHVFVLSYVNTVCACVYFVASSAHAYAYTSLLLLKTVVSPYCFNETAYGGCQCSKYFPCLDLIPKWRNRELG